MTKSIFHTLSPNDRNQIIALCEKHTYQQVLEMIAKPKSDGGMGIHTSVSALCRFYVRHHPLAQRIIIDSQLAEAMDETFFESGDIYFRGIISMTQQRLFSELREGKTIDKLSPTYRLLLALRRDYYKLLQLRSKSRGELDPVPDKYFDPSENDDPNFELAETSAETSSPTFSSPSPEQTFPGSLSVHSVPSCSEKQIAENHSIRGEISHQNSTETARNSTFSTNSTSKNYRPARRRSPPLPSSRQAPDINPK